MYKIGIIFSVSGWLSQKNKKKTAKLLYY